MCDKIEVESCCGEVFGRLSVYAKGGGGINIRRSLEQKEGPQSSPSCSTRRGCCAEVGAEFRE